MRIKGPDDGTPTTEAVTGADGLADVGEVAPSERPGVARIEALRPAAGAAATDAIAQVAARLRAGEIDLDQAVELLIDDAIKRQVGSAVRGRPEVEPELREVLRHYAANDPYIAAKIRRLTRGK